VDTEFSDDEEKRWDGSTPFDQLPTKSVPAADLPEHVYTLRSRLLAELDRYFPVPSKHQLLSMALDPVMLTTGFPYLRRCGLGDYVTESLAELYVAVFNEAQRVWKPAVLLQHEDINDDMSVDSNDPFAAIPSNEPEPPTANQIGYQSPLDLAGEVYKNWTELEVNWTAFLINEQKQLLSVSQQSKANKGDCFFLTDVINIMEWFRINGWKYKMISRLAAKQLAAPDSNAMQERVFSFCKLIDTVLRQRLGHSKFEMLTMLAFNKDFIAFSEKESPQTFDSLKASLRSASCVTAAAACLTEFYDLEVEDAEDGSEKLSELLQDAALAIEDDTAKHHSKRSRLH
jgi:hypothetical protein